MEWLGLDAGIGKRLIRVVQNWNTRLGRWKLQCERQRTIGDESKSAKQVASREATVIVDLTDMVGVVQEGLSREGSGKLDDGDEDWECGPSPSDPRESLISET